MNKFFGNEKVIYNVLRLNIIGIFYFILMYNEKFGYE